jgi:hypothetical protein
MIIMWLFFSALVGIVADRRKRNGFGWFVLALFISPLFAGLLVLVLPARFHVVYTTMPDGTVTAAAISNREIRAAISDAKRPEGVAKIKRPKPQPKPSAQFKLSDVGFPVLIGATALVLAFLLTAFGH